MYLVCLAIIFISGHSQGFTQLSMSAQIRTRSEMRDGQGTLLPKGSDAAFFVSQRSRLNVQYVMPRIKAGFSLQDVRVWGQDVSTINRNTAQELNGLMLHEAWAEVLLSDTANKTTRIVLKVGRQELVYDDQRLVGNLDWLQQARRHDAALIKFEHNSWRLHGAFAFNQNRENQSGTVFNSTTPGGYAATTNGGVMYKSMQMFYAARSFRSGHLSFLFLSDQFSRYSTDSLNNVLVKNYRAGTWARHTTGFYYESGMEHAAFNASAYYQFGRNNSGEKTSAILLSAFGSHKTRKWNIGAGIDFTSGSPGGGTNKTFDPLYGTPHKFWGAMDYFYAGSGFGKGGLVDVFARIRYQANSRFSITADAHSFSSASSIPNVPGRRFGEEVDVIASWLITRDVSLEGGVAHFFNTAALTSPSVKNVANAKQGANWAYLMLNVKPQFIFK
jgi:hypothetical protein